MTKERVERLIYLDHLIRTKATGTPQQLAQKLKLTPSGWYRFRDILVNDFSWPLAYDSVRCTYYYTENVKFEIGLRRLDKDQTSIITGGAKLFSENFSHSIFSRVRLFSFALNL